MARPLRLEFAGAIYHITARGNRKEPIFLTDRDRIVFLKKLDDTLEKYSFLCYAYCLMTNHYHLLLRTPSPDLAKGMHYLNASYTNWFKVKHKLVGVVFQGRYKAILVEEEAYARTLAAYIHLNPARAGIVEDVTRYPWSSYPILALGYPSRLERFDPSFILNLFCPDAAVAAKAFTEFVRSNAKMADPFKEVKKGCVLGSKEFVEKVTAHVRAGGRIREIPGTRIPPLDAMRVEALVAKIAETFGVEKDRLFDRRKNNRYRQVALYFLEKHFPLKLKEIGEIFGMDYAAVHASIKRLEKLRPREKAVEAMISDVEGSGLNI